MASITGEQTIASQLEGLAGRRSRITQFPFVDSTEPPSLRADQGRRRLGEDVESACTPPFLVPDPGAKLDSRSARSLVACGTLPYRDTQMCRARDRKSTRLNSSHVSISYAVFCL